MGGEKTLQMASPAACVDTLGRICASFQMDSLLTRLSALADALLEDQAVDVAILGQFKAGKSSFINSIVGKSVLPVGVLPATAVVTRVGYGAADRATVLRNSGNALEIPIKRLHEFVTEDGNPENEKGIYMVEVEIPFPMPYKGIRFVDTPGLGSLFAHNTQTSRDWLPRVGAAIVAIGIDRPLSEQDLMLIEELLGHTPEVVLLLTKADFISEDDRKEVVDFTRKQAERRVGRELAVFPYSIRPELSSLCVPVEEYLRHRVAQRYRERREEILRHKIRMLAAVCRGYLDLAKGAAEAAGKARDVLQEELCRERSEFDSLAGGVRLFGEDLKSRVQTAADERYQSYRAEMTGRLRASLRENSACWTGNLARTCKDFRQWLDVGLEGELGLLTSAGGGHLAPFIAEAERGVSRTVRAFQDRLSKAIEDALGISFAGASFHAEMARPARPDLRVGKTFDIPVDLVWFLVPMRLFRPVVYRHFDRMIPWEVEKNLSRLATQWSEAVNASIGQLTRRTVDFLRDELSAIERMVSGAVGRQEDIQKAIDELAAQESGLCAAPEPPGQQI